MGSTCLRRHRVCNPFIRYFHPQLEPMVPHLNGALLRIAKERFESRMPDKLFDLLRDKLFLYYSYEEQLDNDLSVEERRRISTTKSKLSKYVYPYEEYCKKLIELKETLEMQKLIEEPEEKEALVEIEGDLIRQIGESETNMFNEIIKPTISKDTSIILEIRAGVGGAEAALFAKDLATMYEMFAELKGWNFETMSVSDSEYGGYKDITVAICGGSMSI